MQEAEMHESISAYNGINNIKTETKYAHRSNAKAGSGHLASLLLAWVSAGRVNKASSDASQQF